MHKNIHNIFQALTAKLQVLSSSLVANKPPNSEQIDDGELPILAAVIGSFILFSVQHFYFKASSRCTTPTRRRSIVFRLDEDYQCVEASPTKSVNQLLKNVPALDIDNPLNKHCISDGDLAA